MRKNKLKIYTGIICLSLSLTSSIKLSKASEYKNYSIIEESDISLVAHRGFSSLAVENSKESILLALNDDNIDGIEFDIRLTKDNVLVLSHGNSITSNDNKKIKISDTNIDELIDIKYKISTKNHFDDYKKSIEFTPLALSKIKRLFEISKKDGSIITLEEVLNIVKDKKKFYIEIKFNENFDQMTNSLETLLSKYDNLNFIIQSNNYEFLLKMKELYPKYKYHIIIGNEENMKYLDSNFDGYAIRYNLVNKKVLEKIISSNKEVSLWTINNFKDFKKIKEYSEEYFNDINYITDYPDLINSCNKKETRKR